MNKQFERELKELLDRHQVKLELHCYDLTAMITYDDEDSVNNFICEQGESMHECTVVNDCLKSN